MPRLEEDGAPFPYVFVYGFDLTLDGSQFNAPWAFFTSTLAMAASRWMATWGETIFVEKLWALFHPNCKLVRTGNAANFLGEEFGCGLADQPPDDLSDGKGTDSAIGFGGRDNSRSEICAEDLCWDVGGGESPKDFPHAVTWVSVKFGHPGPMLVPSTTRSRGSVGGREFDGEQELAEEALLRRNLLLAVVFHSLSSIPCSGAVSAPSGSNTLSTVCQEHSFLNGAQY